LNIQLSKTSDQDVGQDVSQAAKNSIESLIRMEVYSSSVPAAPSGAHKKEIAAKAKHREKKSAAVCRIQEGERDQRMA
jgi:hypothetical protein